MVGGEVWLPWPKFFRYTWPAVIFVPRQYNMNSNQHFCQLFFLDYSLMMSMMKSTAHGTLLRLKDIITISFVPVSLILKSKLNVSMVEVWVIIDN